MHGWVVAASVTEGKEKQGARYKEQGLEKRLLGTPVIMKLIFRN
jgi:hypothetical protein